MVRSGHFWEWWVVGYQLLPSQKEVVSVLMSHALFLIEKKAATVLLAVISLR